MKPVHTHKVAAVVAAVCWTVSTGAMALAWGPADHHPGVLTLAILAAIVAATITVCMRLEHVARRHALLETALTIGVRHGVRLARNRADTDPRRVDDEFERLVADSLHDLGVQDSRRRPR